MILWKICLVVIVCYFIGNINFSILFSKFILKKDIRSQGSGNPGTMNMIRTFGTKTGVGILALDMLKGVVSALIGMWVLGNPSYIGLFIGGLSAIVGHVYPVFYKFKGGKGIATTLGVFLVVEPLWFLLFFAIGIIWILFFEIGSIGTLFIVSAMIIFESVRFAGNIVILCLLFAMFLITWYAHKSNIYKLLIGKENRVKLIKWKENKAFNKQKRKEARENAKAERRWFKLAKKQKNSTK